ncbi:MAG: hypothetical protein JWM99_3328 [Verrucomicrobiales bacterium]|nr:hypothetical protein [Verrucomicrobiales bacterium]
MRANCMRGALCFVAIFGTLQYAAAIESRSSTRDYQTIVERNPFGLKPPPPPPPPPTNEPPKLEFYLTGFTSIGAPANPKRAYLMSKDAKSPAYYSLTEGQSKDGLEILQIDPKNKSVKVRYNGSEKLMTFATDGIPAAKAAVPAPGARPGLPGQPNAFPAPLPNAAGHPATPSPMNNTTSTPRTIPSRSLRTQPPPTYGGMSGPAPVMAAPTLAVPANGITPQPDMNAEEQIAIMRRQQAETRQAYGLPPVAPTQNAPGPFGNQGNPGFPGNQGNPAAQIPPHEMVYPPIPPP